jgi:hypothetical protein
VRRRSRSVPRRKPLHTQAGNERTVSVVVPAEVNTILGRGLTIGFRIGPVMGRSPTLTLPGVSTLRVCEGLQVGDPGPFIGHSVPCRRFTIPATRALKNLLGFLPASCSVEILGFVFCKTAQFRLGFGIVAVCARAGGGSPGLSQHHRLHRVERKVGPALTSRSVSHLGGEETQKQAARPFHPGAAQYSQIHGHLGRSSAPAPGRGHRLARLEEAPHPQGSDVSVPW